MTKPTPIGDFMLDPKTGMLSKLTPEEKCMSVWVVLKGEKHEGGSVCGVYSTKERAIFEGLKATFSFDGGWTKMKDCELSWENGCDYLSVEEWEVL